MCFALLHRIFCYPGSPVRLEQVEINSCVVYYWRVQTCLPVRICGFYICAKKKEFSLKCKGLFQGQAFLTSASFLNSYFLLFEQRNYF